MNPIDAIVRDGRATPRARRRWNTTIVAAIDFEILYETLNQMLINVFFTFEPVRRYYNGTRDEVDEAIAHASMLSSIGPLRIDDSIFDVMVIYAPDRARRDNYGRAAPHPIESGAISDFLSALRAANVPLGTIQQRGSVGSFWTTCGCGFVEDDLFELLGAFHPRHYTRNDIAMGLTFGPFDADEENPFEDLSITFGFISDETIVQAITALPAPEDVDDPDRVRHVAGSHRINYRGIAQQADFPVRGRGQGVYVLGRSYDRVATTSLARAVSRQEISDIQRYYLLEHRGAAAAAAPAQPPLADNQPPANPLP